MYLEQPSSAKPKMFHNIQHFWSQSECVMLKQLSKELDKHEGKVHSNNNKSKQTNSVRSVDVYPVPMKGDFILIIVGGIIVFYTSISNDL